MHYLKKRGRWILLGIALFAAPALYSQQPTETEVGPLKNPLSDNRKAPFILDKQKQLERFSWWDNRDSAWFKARIPFWDSPDGAIDATYYYRWELATKHMTYGSPESGYTFTEFIDRPNWSGRYGAISCPLGLQIYELRWLKDRRITDDFIRYWFNTPGAQPRSYSNWYGDAVWANYLVNDDEKFLINRLPSMEKQYDGWMQEHWDNAHQMFKWSGMHDGMETNIGSRQTKYGFDGGESYRPTLNAYIYGDLKAMAQTAALAGDTTKAKDYDDKAQKLKARVQSELWDTRRQFFLAQFANDEEKDGHTIKAKTRIYDDGKFAGDAHGRELIGFVPWLFNLPDKNKGYEVAWKNIVDKNVFLAPFGLYTTERNDPLFFVAQGSCVWSGNNWPYANAQTLQAMANVLNDYPQNVISKADYWTVLQSYTRSSRKDGVPYLAEMSDPENGRWTTDNFNHSEHYFHSSYNDLIITGLAGLRPRADNIIEVNPMAPDDWDYFCLDDLAYHGHRISIVWDKSGTRYKRGSGLSLWADGKRIASAKKLGKIKGELPKTINSVALPDSKTWHNFAVNNEGSYFPRTRTSFTSDGTSPGNLVDGVFYYTSPRPLNRWTNEGSKSADEWIETDFGVARTVSKVQLYFLDDGEGKAVRAPQSCDVQFWDGAQWKSVAGQKRSPTLPEGHRANNVEFPTVSTTKMRATLQPQNGAAVGLTEWEIWGEAPLPLPEAKLQNNLAREAKASASYTSRFDTIGELNDGKIEMNGGRNRWTSYESPNENDWVQLDFAMPQTVERLVFCLWADGGGVRIPKRFSVQYWKNGAWHDVEEVRRDPAQPTLLIPNEMIIKPVQTDKLRATFVHNLPGKTGLTEWMVFAPDITP